MLKKVVSTRYSYCVSVAEGLWDLVMLEKASQKKEHGMQLMVVDARRIAGEYLCPKDQA